MNHRDAAPTALAKYCEALGICEMLLTELLCLLKIAKASRIDAGHAIPFTNDLLHLVQVEPLEECAEGC